MARFKYFQDYYCDDHDMMTEHPDPTLMIENTGTEKLSKTIDRIMVAGMKLYDRDRNSYSADTAEELEGSPAYMSKYDDEKDVKMRMREIQRRLRNKVRAESSLPSSPMIEPVSGVITETNEKSE